MRYLSAYILATLGGNKSPSVKDISDILSSVGIDVDKTLAEKVVAQLSGKNIEELIEEGQSKLATLSVGTASSGGAAAPAAEAAKEEKKEEAKKEESEDEEDGDMGFGLFD